MAVKYEKIGEVAGQEIGLAVRDVEQEIVVESRELANLLATLGGVEVLVDSFRENGSRPRQMYVIQHSQKLDRQLIELIDVLILIRYRHPTFVQLSLLECADGQDPAVLR